MQEKVCRRFKSFKKLLNHLSPKKENLALNAADFCVYCFFMNFFGAFRGGAFYNFSMFFYLLRRLRKFTQVKPITGLRESLRWCGVSSGISPYLAS